MRLVLPALAWTLAACVAAGQVERFQLAPGTTRQAEAGARAAERPHPAVVRVIAAERDGVASYGSGTLVDVNEAVGLIVTNWHVVEAATGKIVVVFPDGFRTTANVLKTDRDWDLAALVCAKPNVAPVRISRLAPLPGEMLTIAGYGKGDYRSASGRCAQYLAPAPNLPYEIVELEAAARQGDSGGPIFNARGELAGVLFGHAKGLTSGSYCGRVDQFLKSLDPPRGNPSPQPSQPPAAEQSQRLVPVDRSAAPKTDIELAAQSINGRATSRSLVGDYASLSSDSTRSQDTIEYRASDALPKSHGDDGPQWRQLIGDTPVERAKSAVIALVLLILVHRVLRPGDSSLPKHDPLPID